MNTTATKQNTDCSTRYPLLLVHGVGVRDGKSHRIWGRIPAALTKSGAQVYFGEHDAWGTPPDNALQLKERLQTILAETGATKVNIIAHSKGGLDARYLIAHLCREYDGSKTLGPHRDASNHEDGGGESCVTDDFPIASLTTISTPHHGSHTLGVLLSSVRPLFRPIAFVVNRFYRACGDVNADFTGACEHLSDTHMQHFNKQQPALPQVFSQQFASHIYRWQDHIPSTLTYSFIKMVDGPNDGLVTPESAVFDNYQGELTFANNKGIPHAQQVDIAGKSMLRSRTADSAEFTFSLRQKKTSSSDSTSVPLQVADMLEFYLALVADLKARGY